MITKQEILDKKFSTEFRGYNKEEVDEFLDEIIATLAALEQGKPSSNGGIKALKSEINDSPFY